MAAITAALVKDLRERTQAGMMDCKKALEESNGDVEKAIDWLRQKGLASAAKRSGRATSEGLVGEKANADNTIVAIVEVLCETDFVSRGEDFQKFTADITQKVFDNDPADEEALDKLVGDDLKQLIGTLGENMLVGRFCRMAVQGKGIIGSYIHANGKIGVLVELNCSKDETAANEKLAELAKDIAMQVAATNPASLDRDSLDEDILNREREVVRQKTLEEGKPEKIVDKIVEGRINSFFKEVCLMDQPYIREAKMSIQDLVDQTGKELDDKISVARFFRIGLGEDQAEEEEE